MGERLTWGGTGELEDLDGGATYDFREVPTGEAGVGAFVEVDELTPVPPASHRTPSSRVIGGRYLLEAPLAEGDACRVYRARHRKLGREFALKLISPDHARDPLARAELLAEARAASCVAHPNIVSVVDLGEDPRVGLYVVMELVEGAPLWPPGSSLPTTRRACEVLMQLSDALDHLHRHGLVHGDLELDDIVVTSSRTRGGWCQSIKLLDFGLARRLGRPGHGAPAATPEYLAPERVGGGPPTVAADLYALGVCAYALLTGTLPFRGDAAEVLAAQRARPPAPMAQRAGRPVDERLEALVARALAKDPAERHKDVAAFQYELKTVMEMLGMRRRVRTLPTVVSPDRDLEVVAAFDRSRLPQAHVTAEGEILLANRAFAKLVGARGQTIEGSSLFDTPLPGAVPGLVRDLRATLIQGIPCERRAVVPHRTRGSLKLIVWLIPTGGGEVQVLVRVEEEAAAAARDAAPARSRAQGAS